MNAYRAELLLCGSTGCHASGSRAVKDALQKELVQQNLHQEIRLIET